MGHEDDTAGDSLAHITFSVETNKPIGTPNNKIAMRKREKIISAKKAEVEFNKQHFENRFKNFVLGTQENPLQLEAVFVSHPDKDHYKLLPEFKLLPRFFVLGGDCKLYTVGKFMDYFSDKGTIYATKPRQNHIFFNKELAEKKVCFKKEDKILPPKVEILSVNSSSLKDKNKDSMIIKITYDNHSMIIPGDAEDSTWLDAERNYGSLEADILLLSHHGSDTNDSTSETLLTKIKPRISLITAGFQHHHPRYKIIKLLLDYYKNTQFKTVPHFVTYFKEGTGKSMFPMSMLTNAPIFTTIDNGQLTVDLTTLEVKCSRDFNPTPDAFLSNDEGFIYYLDSSSKREFFDEDTFKKYNNKKAIKESVIFGKNVYEVGTKHYYKYGTAYLKMELVETDEESESSSERRVFNKLCQRLIIDL